MKSNKINKDYYKIVWLFHKLENNSVRVISEKINKGLTYVDSRINHYLESRRSLGYKIRDYDDFESFYNEIIKNEYKSIQ